MKNPKKREHDAAVSFQCRGSKGLWKDADRLTTWARFSAAEQAQLREMADRFGGITFSGGRVRCT